MNKEFRLIFTGGGSGGHTMPAFSMIQAVRKHCKKKNIKCSLIYIGSHRGVEKEIANRYNVDFIGINTGKLRRYLSFKNFIDVFKTIKGINESKKIIKTFKPDILISTGGFVSVPPVIAAKKQKVPVIIHEQTIDAGLANKIAGLFANKIALAFHESRKYFPYKKCVITGIPLREEIFNGNRKDAAKKFKFDISLPVVYFTGGGLGCHILNQTAIKILFRLLEKCNVIFQTGSALNNKDYMEMKKFKESLDEYKKKRFIIFDFINDEIGDIYSIADLAIARSGAGTVNEFIALNIPAIFIPLAIAAKNEQLRNAKIVENMQAGIIILEKNLTPDILLKNINDILFSDKLIKMKKNLQKTSNLNGTQNMLNLILEESRNIDEKAVSGHQSA